MYTWLRNTFWKGERRARLSSLIGRRTEQTEVSREAIEHLVGTRIEDLSLYELALKHRSRLRHRPKGHLYSNERLEFLGDAVLGFIVAEQLYHHFPDEPEGFLTRLRSKLVNRHALARCANAINLGVLILMSENMAQKNGRDNQSILANAYEAILGALYLDRGFETTRNFVHTTLLAHVDLSALARQRDNFKSLLLEEVQALGWPQPLYRTIVEEGPSHDRTFTVEVLIRNLSYGEGQAHSKKEAEQRAARHALDRLQDEQAEEA